jgi:outer membrane protein TolC
LEEGQISSFDLIEQQRRLYDAKSRELQARAELNKSITQLWLVTGTVVERAGIHFSKE